MLQTRQRRTHLSEEFAANSGVYLGSVLSPLLFAIVINVTNKTKEDIFMLMILL